MSLVHALALIVAFGRIQDGKDVPAKPTQVKVGDVVNGEVTKDSPLVHTPTLDKGYTDAPVRGVSFTLGLPAGGPVTIELRSYFFDAYLVVRDAKGELVAEDDNGLLGTHSRIVVKSESAATFEVAACALHSGTGPYELRVAAGATPQLAALHRKEVEIEDARRAVHIVEVSRGPQHPDTATSLDNLARLLEAEGNYEEARPLFERALAIREKVLGPEHPSTATSLCNLAGLLEDEGKYEEARPLYERALAIDEKALGTDHPGTATDLNDLALLLEAEGKYEEARPFVERALAIREKVLGPEHPSTATSLCSLAGLLEDEGKYEEARPLFERALAIDEKALGSDDPGTATDLNNLAWLLEDEGRYEEARPLFERALAITEKVLDPEHPDTATSLGNLALLLEYEGKYEEARPLEERALAIREKVLGPDHPDTAAGLNNLALLLLDLGSPVEARGRARERLTSVRMHSLAQATVASDADAMRWIGDWQAALALLLETTPVAERSWDDLYTDVMATKGGAFQLVLARRKRVEETRDPALRAKLERLRSVRAAMSNLFSQREIKDRAQFDRDVERLCKQRVDLETDLARAVDTRPDLMPATPAEVRSRLPKDAVLLDFLDHKHYEPAERKDGKVVKLGKWGERRLSVWMSHGGGSASTWIDLGPSAAIEEAITDYLDSTVRPRGAGAVETLEESLSRAGRLRELVWDPIAVQLDPATTRRVVVCPDGALATLPFGVIEGKDGRPLIETYSFSCVEDATSLTRPLHAPRTTTDVPHDAANSGIGTAPDAAAKKHVPSLLVVGAVDYDQGARLDAAEARVAANEQRGSFTYTWDPLYETRPEAVGIAARHRRRFGDSACLELLKDAPSEERLKAECPKYDVLHFATHGYYLAQGLESIEEAIRDESERAAFETHERRVLVGEWPQFLCGIVCAGANHPQPGRDNGLLTGDEVSGLDLSHCDLAVLSACETALGNRQAGEGLLSLTRSFREAGARTVISSLWKVHDDSTQELMLDFYERLWGDDTHPPQSKLDALRDAQLDMLKKNREKYGDTRPATWGAFVLTGDAN